MATHHSRALASSSGECRYCGISNEEHNEEYGQNLHVHHIDGDSDNNDLDNLAVLCKICHQKVHRGEDGYEDLHSELPEEKRWPEDEKEWKTLRVPIEAYVEARQQKESEGRTWGQQIVRQPDDSLSVDEEIRMLRESVEKLPNRTADELEGRFR